MTQELRKLAERLSPDRTTVLRIDAEQAGEAILALLDRVEKAENELRDANLHIKQLERGFDRAMEASK